MINSACATSWPADGHSAMQLRGPAGSNWTELCPPVPQSVTLPPTCSQTLQRTLSQQSGDEVLGICWQSILPIWPDDVIWTKQCISAIKWQDLNLSMHISEVTSSFLKAKVNKKLNMYRKVWWWMQRSLTINHLTKKLFWCVSEERHTAHKELIEDNSHGPPVHRLSITLPQDHFWSNVLRCPTHL